MGNTSAGHGQARVRSGDWAECCRTVGWRNTVDSLPHPWTVQHLSFQPTARVVIIKVCHVSQQSFLLAKKNWHCLVIWDHPKMLGSASSQHQTWHRYSANTQTICHRTSWSSGEKQGIYISLLQIAAVYQPSLSLCRGSTITRGGCGGGGTSLQHSSFSHKWQWLPNSCHIIALPATTHAALRNIINWSNRKTAHCDVARFLLAT